MLKNLIPGVVITLLQGCITIATPLKTVDNSEIGSAGQYIIVVTYAQVKKDRHSRTLFNKHLENVVNHLDQQPGLHSFSRRKELFGNKAWTITVWKNEDAISDFVTSSFHLPAVEAAPTILEKSGFYQFTVDKSQLSISWSEAIAKLERHGRAYTY